MSSLLRQLPAVTAVIGDDRLRDLPRGVVVGCTRRVISGLREDLQEGRRDAVPDVVGLVRERALSMLGGRLRPVINATGVVVHTNLGRAPWAPEAIAAAERVARGYCNLEVDLETGRRGGRIDGVVSLLRHLTGCEDALVVNNGAAAVLLALTALAAGREVVVSRGELVEIGGAFRVPDVVASGGARLVEVGTTNRTRAADYRGAVGADTALLLKVHPSNFRVVGFTEDTPREALVGIAREHGLRVVEDLGSGSLDGTGGEPSVGDAVAAGVDLATFSGDKLLGGPQAGVVVGRRAAVAALRAHPLYRALRVGKVTLAALEATLAVHASGGRTPVGAMLHASEGALRDRADRLADLLSTRGIPVRRGVADGAVGGGALPGVVLRSEVVDVPSGAPEVVARRLRTGDPPVIARVVAGHVRLDVRTFDEPCVPIVADRVADAVREQGDDR